MPVLCDAIQAFYLGRKSRGKAPSFSSSSNFGISRTLRIAARTSKFRKCAADRRLSDAGTVRLKGGLRDKKKTPTERAADEKMAVFGLT
jgi:hypothetical protein